MPPKRGNGDKADKARADKAKVTKGARDRDEDEDVVEQASPEKSGRKRRKADAATNSGRSELDDPSQKPARDHKSALIVQVGETVMCRWKDEVRKLPTELARIRWHPRSAGYHRPAAHLSSCACADRCEVLETRYNDQKQTSEFYVHYCGCALTRLLHVCARGILCPGSWACLHGPLSWNRAFAGLGLPIMQSTEDLTSGSYPRT